jgi:hydrogenase nickel incorporation protein HypA/HybF
LRAVHELALMEDVVSLIGGRLGDARVMTVRLEIGRLAGVAPDALRFCFDVCARGTTLEGAALEIVDVPGRARCGGCGAEVAMESFLALCACGSAALEVVAGQELRIKDVEVV